MTDSHNIDLTTPNGPIAGRTTRVGSKILVEVTNNQAEGWSHAVACVALAAAVHDGRCKVPGADDDRVSIVAAFPDGRITVR